MDYFYVGNTHGQQGRVTGLIDGFFKTQFKFNDKHSLAADLHYFMSPVAIYQYGPLGALDLNDEVNSGLGAEVDLVYKITMSKEVNFLFGYSHMFATESMELIKTHMYNGTGSSNATNNWGWIMLTFKPELFKK